MVYHGNNVERLNEIADFKFDEVVYDTLQEVLTAHPDMNIDALRSNISMSLVEFLLEYQKSHALWRARERINQESIASLEARARTLEARGSTE